MVQVLFQDRCSIHPHVAEHQSFALTDAMKPRMVDSDGAQDQSRIDIQQY